MDRCLHCLGKGRRWRCRCIQGGGLPHKGFSESTICNWVLSQPWFLQLPLQSIDCAWLCRAAGLHRSSSHVRKLAFNPHCRLRLKCPC